MQSITVNNFEQWRAAARSLLSREIPPSEVHFAASGSSLFQAGDAIATSSSANTARVPKKFLELARAAACHGSDERWPLLYRLLWRITNGEPRLLGDALDDDVARLSVMTKAVSRDAHKAKAFVRFRRIESADGGEHYVAWHRPDHRILRLVAPFFSRRFSSMHWSILTPDESVTWDLQKLHYGPGVPAREAPPADELESLWRTYYGSIFNPARIKIKAMKREMPVRHWATLPETQIIADLLDDAPRRVKEMIDRAPPVRPPLQIPKHADLVTLASAARTCTGCDLHCRATQTVFGEGPANASIVLVGEQPGDEEDIAGRPFVGPAGRLLDEALAEAGVDRSSVYLTNVVKHFNWEPRGTRRLHKKPHAREIAACLPWLRAELALIRPQVLVCLGNTATQALLGRHVKLGDIRGNYVSTPWCPRTLPSWHPASILRLPPGSLREQRQAELVAHLRSAGNRV